MKLTKSKLKQIIKEELGRVQENPEPLKEAVDDETFAMVDAIVEALGDPQKALDELVLRLPKDVARDALLYIMQKMDIPFDADYYSSVQYKEQPSDDEEDYNPEYYNRYGGHPGGDDDI